MIRKSLIAAAAVPLLVSAKPSLIVPDGLSFPRPAIIRAKDVLPLLAMPLGVGAIGGGVEGPKIGYHKLFSNTTNSTTYAWTAASGSGTLGGNFSFPAVTSRLAVVTVTGRNNSDGSTVSLSQVRLHNDDSDSWQNFSAVIEEKGVQKHYAGIWRLPLTDGANYDELALTFTSNNLLNVVASLYVLTGLASLNVRATGKDTGSIIDADPQASLALLGGGIVIAVAYMSTAGTISNWIGPVVNRHQTTLETSHFHAGADCENCPDGATTIGVDYATTYNSAVFAAAHWL